MVLLASFYQQLLLSFWCTSAINVARKTLTHSTELCSSYLCLFVWLVSLATPYNIQRVSRPIRHTLADPITEVEESIEKKCHPICLIIVPVCQSLSLCYLLSWFSSENSYLVSSATKPELSSHKSPHHQKVSFQSNGRPMVVDITTQDRHR